MQQHAGNAGESVRVAQEHTFFEPCGMREVVRGDADEGDAGPPAVCRRTECSGPCGSAESTASSQAHQSAAARAVTRESRLFIKRA